MVDKPKWTQEQNQAESDDSAFYTNLAWNRKW